MTESCMTCSGKTASFDGTKSVDLSLAMTLGEEARLEELRPGSYPGALTRWSTDADLWHAIMGEERVDAYPAEAMLTIRDLFDAAWNVPLRDLDASPFRRGREPGRRTSVAAVAPDA